MIPIGEIIHLLINGSNSANIPCELKSRSKLSPVTHGGKTIGKSNKVSKNDWKGNRTWLISHADGTATHNANIKEKRDVANDISNAKCNSELNNICWKK